MKGLWSRLRAALQGPDLTRRLAPQSLVGRRAGYALATACLLALVGLAISDLFTPPNVTVSAIGVFAVLAAAWFLSLRLTIVVLVGGVLLQVLLIAIGAMDEIRGQLHIEGVYWLTAVADIAAFTLTAALGRFAAGNWATVNAGLQRERGLHREKERARQQVECVLEVTRSILDGQPIEDVLRLVAARARTLSGAALAAVAVPDGGHRTYTIQAVEGEGATGLIGLRVRATSGTSGSVLRTRVPMKIDDLTRGLSGSDANQGVFGPAILLPLAAGRRRFGTLVLANLKGSPPFGADDALVEVFAAQAAVGLEYARVRDELRRIALLEDRNRISEELHDGVIQSLFAIGLDLEANASSVDPKRREALTRSIGEINGVIRDLRGFIYGLVPGLLDEHELHGALLKLAQDFTNRSKIHASASIDPKLADMLAPQGLQIILFASEALSNLARHSGATSCSLSLTRMGDDAVLEIRDEGIGFDPAQAGGRGFGLHNLSERASRLGGRLDILSAPGAGTTVRLVIPFAPGGGLQLTGGAEPEGRVGSGRR